MSITIVSHTKLSVLRLEIPARPETPARLCMAQSSKASSKVQYRKVASALQKSAPGVAAPLGGRSDRHQEGRNLASRPPPSSSQSHLTHAKHASAMYVITPSRAPAVDVSLSTPPLAPLAPLDPSHVSKAGRPPKKQKKHRDERRAETQSAVVPRRSLALSPPSLSLLLVLLSLLAHPRATA